MLKEPFLSRTGVLLMRTSLFCLSLILVGTGFLVTSGCGGNDAEVAPRTDAEVAEYKKQVYGAEEEEDAEGDDDE